MVPTVMEAALAEPVNRANACSTGATEGWALELAPACHSKHQAVCLERLGNVTGEVCVRSTTATAWLQVIQL